MRPKITEEEAQEFKRLYLEGLDVTEIAAKTGRSRNGIWSALRRAGVTLRPGRRPMRIRDIPVGTRFGRLLTVSEPFMTPDHKKSRAKARCDCGTFVEVQAENLVRGNTTSCGCLRREKGRHCGRENPAYRGGWWLMRGRRVCSIQTPDGGRYTLYEHILVMERRQGRSLAAGEQVHHIDSRAVGDNDHFCKACGEEWPELEGDGLLHCPCGWTGKPNLQLRVTAHGAGSAYACSDCGSARIHPVPLTDLDNSHIATRALERIAS